MKNIKKEMKSNKEWHLRCTKDIWFDGESAVKGSTPVFKKDDIYVFVLDGTVDLTIPKHPITLTEDLVYVCYDNHKQLHYWSIEGLEEGPFELVEVR